MKLLLNTNKGIHIAILESHLRDNGVNILKKSKGSGGYLEIATGGSFYGTDVYVNENDYDKAEKLLRELNF